MKPRTMAHVSWWLASTVAIAAVSLAEAVILSWPGLLTAAAGAFGGYVVGRARGRRSAARAATLAEARAARLAGEVLGLRAEIGRLYGAGPAAGNADDAQESPSSARVRLLADPRSGAHPLGGAR